MLPANLTAEDFRAYLPEAKAVALKQLPLLQRLPLSLVPLLLRELIQFDWKFPAERRDLLRQFSYLASVSAEDFPRVVEGFSQLKLTPELENNDWVNSPAAFSEQLSAHLWATHQIDAFRSAATKVVSKAAARSPDPLLSARRLTMAVIGNANQSEAYPLFRKLAPHGALYTQVKQENGMATLLDAAAKRAALHPEPYAHWYIDGGALNNSSPGLTRVSYQALSPARAALQGMMQRTYENGAFDPEAFRSMLARTRPEDLGLNADDDAVLKHFQLSVLTEGSGTQVFATTFVQWTAREALRRAQPLTLVARFTPRQREKPMGELLAESQRKPELDPSGSLIDADLGAYYTWLNQQRLAGAEDAAFLAWFEDHGQAVAIGPSIKKGAREKNPVQLTNLITNLVE